VIDRTFVQGSTADPIVLQLQEMNGQPVDLRPVTQVRFHVWPADRCAPEIVTDAEILDARHGVVRHFFSAREVARAVVMLVNVSWIDANGRPRVLPDNHYVQVQLIPNGRGM